MNPEKVRKAKIAGNTEALSKMGAAGGRQAAKERLRLKVHGLDEAAAVEIKIMEEFLEQTKSGNGDVVPFDPDEELDK